jgi:hypothetical protein
MPVTDFVEVNTVSLNDAWDCRQEIQKEFLGADRIL